jgi:hypothetical protein
VRKLLTKRVRAAISKTASEEQALKELLDESTFRSVVACFKIATSDELP